MGKQNCWEAKNCGRETNGDKCEDMGVCPAASEKKADGIHGGLNGGRVCWAIAGTLCGGEVQGTYATKMENCGACDFYRSVQDEEGRDFLFVLQIFEKLR